VLRWDEPTASPVEARVGISYVDGEQAALHRTLEVEGASLEEVREAATALWLEKLGRIRFGGLSESDARVFATAIYNTYRMPTTLSGADGRYRGLDGEVHEAEGFTYYTDLSLWDTFRTFHPWLALTDPEEQRNCLRSLERMQQEGGYYPRWPAAISYTNGMIGTSADIVLAESALKGFDDAIDWDAAFDSLYETATQPTEAGSGYGGRGGIDDYLTLGYLPEERHSSSVSRVLEYAWNDWALANLAEHLGREEAEELRGRGRSFLTLFHEDSLFFRPRLEDGSFDTSVPVSRIEMGGGAFTEGTAWHWRFYALHEVEAFAEAMGGAEAMGDALEEFFARSALGRGTGHIDHKLPDVHYWHGNEPALHSAYLFHHAGRPERLQHWVREIQTRVYWDDEAGLPGNDDGGTMSTWYLFNGVGLYPLAGSDRYFVSTPLAPVAEIETAGGVLRIEAPGASAERRFVRSLTLDGVPVDGYELRHADLQDATLRFEMSAEAP
jgi:predicted alpha-1,2-mannosidase